MTDAFTLAHLLAVEPTDAALAGYEERRKAPVEGTVKSARALARWMTSESALSAWAFRSMLRMAPTSMIMHSLRASERPNDVSDLTAAGGA